MLERKNLSLHLSKEQLDKLVHDLAQQHYLIFWGFDRGTMILNVYHTAANNQFAFIRHRHSMELIYARIVDEDVLIRLNQAIQFEIQAAKQQQSDQLSNQVRYQEIDYYLCELYDYMQEKNKEKISETKSILQKLVSDAC